MTLRPVHIIGAVLVAILFLLLLVAVPAQAGKRGMRNIVPEIMARAVEDAIRPGYGRFHTATTRLDEQMDTLCDAPGTDALTNTRAQFSAAVAAWSGIEMIRFGPVTAKNRHERVLFYPDPRGTALRQLQAIFANPENFPPDIQALQNKSVAVQGLSALEFALFGTGSDQLSENTDEATIRCRYASLVSANLQIIAAELDQAWSDPDGIARIYMEPGPDNPVLPHFREALVVLLGATAHGLESIADVRLRAFLRATPERDKPKLALLWRSKSTFVAITAQLKGLRNLFENAGMSLALPDGSEQIGYQISQEFNEVITLSGSFGDSVADTLADPDTRARLVDFREKLIKLKKRIGEDYGNAVGLTTGFFFADGD